MTSSLGPFWWRQPTVADGLQVALDHANEASGRYHSRAGGEPDACDCLFRALNQLATSLDSLLPSPEPDPATREVGRRKEPVMHSALLDEIADDGKRRLIADEAVGALA